MVMNMANLLLGRGKANSGGMGRAKDFVAFPGETRERFNSGDNEVTLRHIDEMYIKKRIGR